MKKILIIPFLLLISCSNEKMVYWCGDHACINKKEREAYFKKTMIVEVKEADKNKINKTELKKITEEIILSEKKRIKDKKLLAKQARLEEKRKIKELKELKKQARIEEKRIIKVKKKNDKKKLKKQKNINEIKDDKIIIDTEIASLDFKKLVEKIKKQNITKPYPNISIIER